MYSFVNHVLASKLCDLDRNGLLSICQYAAFFPESELSNDFDNSFNLEPLFSGFASDLSVLINGCISNFLQTVLIWNHSFVVAWWD